MIWYQTSNQQGEIAFADIPATGKSDILTQYSRYISGRKCA